MHRRQRLLLILLASLLLLGAFTVFALAGTRRARAKAPSPATQVQAPAAPAACPQDPLGGGPKERFRIIDTGNSRLVGFNMDDDDNVNWGSPTGSAGSDDGELNNPQGVGHVIGAGTYVADTGNDRIQVFDWKLRYDFQFDGSDSDVGTLDAPTDVAISIDKTIYVADSGNDRIMVFNKKGEYQESWGSTGGGDGEFRRPYAIAFSRGGEQIYVADRDNDRIQYFDKNGVYLGQWNSGGGSLEDPTGISVHPTNGDVYVADRARDQVIQFEADGTYVDTWGGSGSGNGEFDGPMDVAATPVHGVFVADTGNDRIQRFTDNGAFIEAFGSPGSGSGSFSGPAAVTARLMGVRMQECYIHNFTLDGEPRQITVFYTHDSGLPRHHIPDTTDSEGNNIYAKEVAELTEEAWRTFKSYGLKDPAHKRNDVTLDNGETGDDVNVWMFGETMAGRCCHGWGYSIKARTVENSVDGNTDTTFEVVVHELFHSIQFNHGYGQGSQPGFHWEGGAANAEDKVDATVDDDAGSIYMGRVRHYLSKSHESDIRDLKYVAGLFWTYFQEQLTDGSISEPGYGIDATDALMRDILTDYRGLDGVAEALRQMDDDGRSLEAFWIDFTTANYVKDFSGVDPQHRYVDDDTLPNNYRSAAAEEAALSSAGASTFFTGTLKAYSAHYYRLRPDNAVCPYVMVEVDSDKRLALTLANHRGSSLIAPLETRKGDRLAVTLRTAQPLAGSDDGAGIILSGLREKGDYRVDAACITPTLDIITPNNGHPGFAGPHDDAGTLIVTVEVSNDGAAPVKGLSPDQFTATIGGTSTPVMSATYIDDLYVLVLDAPNQAAAGLYDLQVTLDGDQSDSETGAVKYTSQVRDNVLTLDRSGSMGNDNKMFTAQQAAQLQITDMDRNAWSGLVSFSENARLDFPLQDITQEPERGNLREEVNGLSPDTSTNIVAGVNRALDELDTNGGNDHGCFITLLSDGKDNEATAVEEANLLGRLGSDDCQVYAVALGPEADKTLLQEVADASGGELYVSTLTPSGARAAGATAPADTTAPADGYGDATWEHQLMGFFEEIALQQEGRERLYVGASSAAGTYTDTLVVDDSLSELVFAVQNHFGYTRIYDPTGEEVDVELYPGLTFHGTAYHTLYRFENPIAGQWRLETTAGEQSDFAGHLVTASGHTSIGLELIARAPTDPVEAGPLEAGEAVPIVAMLNGEEGLIAGAEVSATVRSSNGGVTQLTLFDDGDHGDGDADDGVYANLYKGATLAPCRTDPETDQEFCDEGFQVNATAVKDDVRREASTAFSITTAADSDGDTMPDNWEERNGTDPQHNDALEDPDGDGLYNVDEYWYKTNPHKADTDGGGENDISEIFGGGDPNDPTDDRVPLLHGIQVRPGDGEVGIVYTPHPAFDSINIYRRRPGTIGWNSIATGVPVSPNGVYTDTTPINGLDYEYRFVPVISGGYGGAPVTSIPTTPGTDTDAPEGTLTINDGAARTAYKRVTLSLDFESDAVDMRLSNDGDFSDDAWEPVAGTKEWDLADDVASGEVAVVYVQYRDASGNVGFDIYQQDSILYERPTLHLPLIIAE